MRRVIQRYRQLSQRNRVAWQDSTHGIASSSLTYRTSTSLFGELVSSVADRTIRHVPMTDEDYAITQPTRSTRKDQLSRRDEPEWTAASSDCVRLANIRAACLAIRGDSSRLQGQPQSGVADAI